MTRAAIRFLLLAAGVLLMAGCNTNIFSEKIDGFPLFAADADLLDFGRIEVNTSVRRSLLIRNLGAAGSEMYVFAAAEGSPAYRVTSPADEVMLVSGEQRIIAVEFAPVKGGNQEGKLTIYTSDRPLTGQVNVKTYYFPLYGWAGADCVMPEEEGFPSSSHFSHKLTALSQQ